MWLAVALGTGEGLRRLPLRAGRVLRVGAWLALGILGALMAVVRVSGPVPYLGGFLVAALAGCLLIVQILAAPDALLARALAWKPSSSASGSSRTASTSGTTRSSSCWTSRPAGSPIRCRCS